MASYIISCCSTADLSREHFEKRDIHYICFHFQLNGKEYLDDLGASIPFPEFYFAMSQGADTATSQVNMQEYLEYFDRFMKQGKDVLHVCLSTGLSGTYNSARNAATILRERYPERKIYIIDSRAASSGLGLLMDALADHRDGGMDIDALRDWTEDNKQKLNHWFFSTDLTFYVKGGRISRTAGIFGGVLGICPLLNMNREGRLIPRHKIRGKRKVMQEIVKRMEECAENGRHYNGKCYISHSACYEDALTVAAMVQHSFKFLDGPVEIYDVGTTIGSHTGPGTVALFFWGEKRTD